MATFQKFKLKKNRQENEIEIPGPYYVVLGSALPVYAHIFEGGDKGGTLVTSNHLPRLGQFCYSLLSGLLRTLTQLPPTVKQTLVPFVMHLAAI